MPTLSLHQWRLLASQSDLASWVKIIRGYKNIPKFHYEWYDVAQDDKLKRVCILAPREFAKSDIFAVSYPVWKVINNPNYWVYLFSNNTEPQAIDLLARCEKVIMNHYPELKPSYGGLGGSWHKTQIVLVNGSRITAKGQGVAVRGGHPDLIIADDILDEDNCLTEYQRRKLKRWFFETVSNMAKPGTKIIVVGTPQHEGDLLYKDLRENPLYFWRRYYARYEGDQYYETA